MKYKYFCKKPLTSKQLQNKNITRRGLITEYTVEKSFLEELDYFSYQTYSLLIGQSCI